MLMDMSYHTGCNPLGQCPTHWPSPSPLVAIGWQDLRLVHFPVAVPESPVETVQAPQRSAK